MKIAALAVGLVFGFMIGSARLNDYDVIHRMLLLQEPDVFLLMASAIGVAAPSLLLLSRLGWRTPFAGPLNVPRLPPNRNTVLGSVVFGTGWAIAGTCPGPAIAMVAMGSVPGVFVTAGIIVGASLHGAFGRLPELLLTRRRPAALNPG